jgi:hypothetical protein
MAELEEKAPTGEISVNDPDVAVGETEPYLQELTALKADGANLMFEAQAALLNHAVQKIGMGKYQWGLFVLAGYGWLCDQVNCTHILQIVLRMRSVLSVNSCGKPQFRMLFPKLVLSSTRHILLSSLLHSSPVSSLEQGFGDLVQI